MSREILTEAMGRLRSDPAFAGKCRVNLAVALREAGLELSQGEVEFMERTLQQLPPPVSASAASPLPPNGAAGPWADGPLDAEDVAFRKAMFRRMAEAQFARAKDLNEYSVNILKTTLRHARLSYLMINWMNTAMFATGLALFIAAAVIGTLARERDMTLLLAGMGVTNFVAWFLIRPVERMQTTLSNLVQVEIAFMNYFEQITFWETYALAPRPNRAPGSDLEVMQTASLQLQRRSEETIRLLQTYVEDAGDHHPSKKEAAPST